MFNYIETRIIVEVGMADIGYFLTRACIGFAANLRQLAEFRDLAVSFEAWAEG